MNEGIKEAKEEAVTLQTIEKIRDFMFEDLDKTIALVNSCKGAPNFMLTLVLCCYTEFWGKLKAFPEQKECKECFESFFSELGEKYRYLIEHTDAGIWGNVRSQLVHLYGIKEHKGAVNDSRIVIEGGDCGIIYDNKAQTYTFYVRKYFEDFKFAVDKYIEELKADPDKLDHAKNGLKDKKVRLL
jgi:hypothetical protein